MDRDFKNYSFDKLMAVFVTITKDRTPHETTVTYVLSSYCFDLAIVHDSHAWHDILDVGFMDCCVMR